MTDLERMANPQTKNDFTDKIHLISVISENDRYYYKIKISEWANYGKNRTYFKICEYRKNDGKNHGEYDYGYYDNNSDCYIKTKKYNDLNDGKIRNVGGMDVDVDDKTVKMILNKI